MDLCVDGCWKELERICITGKCSPDCKVTLTLNSCNKVPRYGEDGECVCGRQCVELECSQVYSMEISFASQRLTRLPFDEIRKERRGRVGFDILGASEEESSIAQLNSHI